MVTLSSPSPGEPPPRVEVESVTTVRSVVRVTLTIISVVIVLWLIYLLRQPIGWIVVAGFIAIALSGPVNLLERKMKRGFAMALVYLALILAPFALIGILVPPIVNEANKLVQNFPDYAAQVQDFVNNNDTLAELEQDYDLTGKLREEAEKLPARLGDAAGLLSDIGLGLVNSIFQAVTILILSVFMLGGAPRFRDFLVRQQPADRAAWLDNLWKGIANAVGNYVGAALLQATIAGVTSWIVLMILGIPGALPLAVVIFLLDLIPLVGATIGAVVVGFVTLFGDFPADTIIWAIWAIIYQQIENNVIQPRLQSKALSLEPFVVLVSVLFGSTLFGVPGALLAIPFAAAIQITVQEIFRYRRSARLSRLVDEPGAAPSTPPPPPSDEPSAAG